MSRSSRLSIPRLAERSLWTLLVIGCAAGAVVLGQGILAQRLSAQDGSSPAPVTSVSVATVALQRSYRAQRRFAGQFEPRQEVALGFEEGGTIIEIRVEEGSHVVKGETVARLDTRLLEAERARRKASRTALLAQVELARRTDARQSELRNRGFATDQTVDDTSLSLLRLEAQVGEIGADIEALEVRLSKAVLKAPFDGLVGERFLDDGAIAAPGAPALTVLQDGPVLFRVGVAPSLVAGLSGQDTFEVIAEGKTHLASISRIAPGLEVATRARTVFFRVDAPAPPSRTSGEVLLMQEIQAHAPGAWMPLGALRQGPRGTWQVLTVEDNKGGPVASMEAVEIVHVEDGHAFVTGTIRDGMRYIPEGSHRVVPGDRLRLIEYGAGADDARAQTATWAR